MNRRAPSGELQERTCRSCGRRFKYPVPRSLATRFYCEACVALPAETRAVFEHYHQRVRNLTAEIDRTKAELAALVEQLGPPRGAGLQPKDPA